MQKISIKQAARILEVKPDTIYHHINKNHYTKDDKTGMIEKSELKAYVVKSYWHHKQLAEKYENIYRRIN